MDLADTPVAVDGLCAWLARTYGDDIALSEPVATRGEGFDSDVYFVRFEGTALPPEWRAPLVLRVKPDAGRTEEAEREAAVQDWVADRGYPAPRVLVVLAPREVSDRPAQVMTRAPGAMMLDALKRRAWQARRLLERLAVLQARLHELPPGDFPVTDDLLDRRLALVRRVSSELDDDALRRGLDAIEARAADLRDAPPSACHGDFHPLNVLVTDDGMTVIDWTDAGVGDRHGDVARTLLLFELAAIAASSAAERAVLRRVGPWLNRTYRRAYDEAKPLDPHRLALWTPVHLLHGWTQVRALHAGLFGDSGAAARVPPALVDELQRRFDAALAHLS